MPTSPHKGALPYVTKWGAYSANSSRASVTKSGLGRRGSCVGVPGEAPDASSTISFGNVWRKAATVRLIPGQAERHAARAVERQKEDRRGRIRNDGWRFIRVLLAQLWVLFVVFTPMPWASLAGGQAAERAVVGEATATPTSVAAKSLVKVAVEVRNDGSRTWEAAGDRPVRMSYHGYGADGREVLYSGERPALPHDVAPGHSLALEAVVRAVDSPGQYRLVWDMVEEKVAWFSESGAPTAAVLLGMIAVASSGPVSARNASVARG